MNIIERNFFNLLRAGAMNEQPSIEPMSLFKWNALVELANAQKMEFVALKGMQNQTDDSTSLVPDSIIKRLEEQCADTTVRVPWEVNKPATLSNIYLKQQLKNIQQNERHEIDASMISVELLNIIVHNAEQILSNGVSLSGILYLGMFLRTKGHKVDFVKMEKWLQKLHMQRMAQLEGSILVSVFEFEPDEIPFLSKIEPAAEKLATRSISHAVHSSLSFFPYAPIEAVSFLFGILARRLSEIEE
ncbi:MAG: hypothetical protein IJS97_06840 [Prevotella sp.]|nr:hypothetical protein [Prevotella sp.]